MNLDEINRVYLIGIGGIGMSALARFFKMQGKEVSGYDKTPTQLTKQLENEGILIHFDDDVEKSDKEADLVIYTPAIPKSHNELNYFFSNDYVVKKRAEVLGLLSLSYKTIAVAGTHGKTTTSSILAHILHSSKFGCTAFVGGLMANNNTNFLHNSGSEYLVVEADEFDRSFLQLHPETAVVTSVDADHLDIYGKQEELASSFSLFAGQVKERLIVKKGLGLNHANLLSYSANEAADYYSNNVKVSDGAYSFDLVTPQGVFKELKFNMPGMHNIENAVGASAVAVELGVEGEELRKALSNYKGVKRRFESILNTPEVSFVDDYAHHPKELEACIHAAREFYPGKKITGVFQPHLYSRTRDFSEGFAKALSLLDEVVLLPIYPAREEPIEGVSSEILLEKTTAINKHLFTKDEAVAKIVQLKPEVLLTLGAGDIDQLVEPLKKALS